MNRPPVTLVATLAVLLLGAGSLRGQTPAERRYELGLGAGYGQVALAETDVTLSGIQYHARVGRRLSAIHTLGLELGGYGYHDEDPRTSDLEVDSRGFVVVRRHPKVVRTTTAVLSLQFGEREGPYLRPGLGFGSHAFASYGPGYTTPVPRFTEASRSYEMGFALSLAAGYRRMPFRGTRLGLEAIGAWSGGEDSSAARTILGVQAVWQPAL